MTSSSKIPFNQPVPSGKEFQYIKEAIAAGQLAGDGSFTERCEIEILKLTQAHSAHLTHSCTAALEMAAILCDLAPGDEVIMPSFTFVSTANAVALRGATPVFVDIDEQTLNIDVNQVAEAITPATKAIWPIHYAGLIADMPAISQLARQRELFVVEDAAQALGSTLDGTPAGSFGDMAAFSFHETKNVISGEGGALVLNNPIMTERAEIIREKGTNRSQFFRGMVDKYSWVDIGSSFLPGELVAAFLLAQLEAVETITEDRMDAWKRYHDAFDAYEKKGLLRRPHIPGTAEHNAHMYYLILPSLDARTDFISGMRSHDIVTPFHYVPLHSAPYGKKCAKTHGDMRVTNAISDRLVRLPLYPGVTDAIDRVIEAAVRELDKLTPTL